VTNEIGLEEKVRRLAEEFGVTAAAMRVGLQQTKMIPTQTFGGGGGGT
jgi:hypothetical protein